MPSPSHGDDAKTEVPNHRPHHRPEDPTHPQPDNSGFEEVATAIRHNRTTTISIALPSSILSNAQSPELRIYLAGQVARAAAIYNIQEIVVFTERSPDRNDDTAENTTRFFTTVLQYLDTPQYLRKHLFPMSQELRLVGLLNPLALPSHPSKNETPRWREGVAYARLPRSRRQPTPNPDANSTSNPAPANAAAAAAATTANASPAASTATPTPRQQSSTRYVDVGLDRLVEIDRPIPVGDRVTIDMSPSGPGYTRAPGKYLFGRLSSRDTPLNTDGTYWGFRVRSAATLSDVFANSNVAPRGYDLTIGTSERGTPISSSGRPTRSFALPEFSHLLIVFGGVHGLERSVLGDEKLEELGIVHVPDNADSNVGDLFDFYLNTCPQQGSRTIRTEEAILLSLAALQPFLNATEP